MVRAFHRHFHHGDTEDTEIAQSHYLYPVTANIRIADCESLKPFVVISMSADPEPEQAILNFNRHGALVRTDSHRPIFAYLLQTQRRVSGVCLEKPVLFVSQFLNRGWQALIQSPERTAGEVPHNSL